MNVTALSNLNPHPDPASPSALHGFGAGFVEREEGWLALVERHVHERREGHRDQQLEKEVLHESGGWGVVLGVCAGVSRSESACRGVFRSE